MAAANLACVTPLGASPPNWCAGCGLGVRRRQRRRTPRAGCSVPGRGRIGDLAQSALIGDDDLRPADPDHVGLLQPAELTADVRPRKTQVVAELLVREGQLQVDAVLASSAMLLG